MNFPVIVSVWIAYNFKMIEAYCHLNFKKKQLCPHFGTYFRKKNINSETINFQFQN
jgi:hypothetical protein